MPNDTPNYKWDHIHLRSPDPEATAAWFETHAGRAGDPLDGSRQAAHRSQARRRRCLHLRRSAPNDKVNPAPVTPYQGLDHFGLAVGNIDAVAASLKAKGVEFTREPTTIRPGVRVCFLRGPQGVSIELLDRDPKYV